MSTITEEQIKAKEFRFGVHIPARDATEPDWHMIKEQVHLTDGTIVPRIRYIKDYERPMWITKPAFRNHVEKKEYECKDRLLVKSVRQSDLRTNIAKALDKGWSRESQKELSASPFVYGTDISSTTIIKKILYLDKYPNVVSPYSLCTFDTETDMIRGTEQIIMASAVYKNRVIIAVDKVTIDGYMNPEERFNFCCKKYLQEYIDKYKLEIELVFCDSEIDVVKTVFNRVHEWKPDWLAIWNMDFDIPKVITACERAGIPASDVLCDPSIPEHMRLCKYKPGLKKKVTASGKVFPISPAAQWHTLFVTASFYVIDAMCVYKQLRGGEQEESSYSLDAILGKELKGLGKLKFVEADGYVKDEWHRFMQKNYIFEYMVYNIFDSFAMLLLDEKTKDLTSTLPSFTATTDYHDFKSQPKRIRDALFWFCLSKHGKVLGTVGPKPKEEKIPEYIPDEDDEFDEDEEGLQFVEEEDNVLDRRNWIVTLPSHLSVLGLPLILEDCSLLTAIRGFVYDSDVVSSYPTCTLVANVSKATTRKEIIRITGIDESVFRMQNLNIILGETNAMDYGVTMFNLPKPNELLEMFLAETQ